MQLDGVAQGRGAREGDTRPWEQTHLHQATGQGSLAPDVPHDCARPDCNIGELLGHFHGHPYLIFTFNNCRKRSLQAL